MHDIPREDPWGRKYFTKEVNKTLIPRLNINRRVAYQMISLKRRNTLSNTGYLVAGHKTVINHQYVPMVAKKIAAYITGSIPPFNELTPQKPLYSC
jgi:hypothetical protein